MKTIKKNKTKFMRINLFVFAMIASLQAEAQSYQKIHNKAIVVDTHNDILMQAADRGIIFDRDLTGITHSDLARWKKGGLDVQLLYYRGLGECRASSWVSDARRLGGLMEKIDCRGGHTQIGKILAHARRENETKKVQALVFVGDAMEEPIDDLCAAAGQLGLLGVPAFVFQEGGDAVAEQAFREIARLSRGAYCRFDISAAHELAELLRAVAAYAAGGMKALADLKARHNSGAIKLLAQLR